MQCLALSEARSEVTRTPPLTCSMRRTGELSTIRRPSCAAIRSAISCDPPKKRDCCAPWRVSKLRSNVPGLVSLPELAM